MHLQIAYTAIFTIPAIIGKARKKEQTHCEKKRNTSDQDS